MIDVFEDRMLGWLLRPAEHLLKVDHGYVAAVCLATTYFEGIEIFHSGQNSDRRSREFFRAGYKRVFSITSGQSQFHDAIANALYELLRCGFAHDAMFRSGVYFSSVRKEAVAVTWPKKNGQFDADGQFQSAVVNPKRFCECVRLHFTEYVSALRSGTDPDLKRNFLAAVALKWRLNEPGHVIGMSEEQFLSGA